MAISLRVTKSTGAGFRAIVKGSGCIMHVRRSSVLNNIIGYQFQSLPYFFTKVLQLLIAECRTFDTESIIKKGKTKIESGLRRSLCP